MLKFCRRHTGLAAGSGKRQIALRVDPGCRAAEAQRNLPGVGVWSDDEVILKLVLIPVVHQIDAGINTAVADLTVGWHVGCPTGGVMAKKLVRAAWELVVGLRWSIRLCTTQRHAQRAALRRRGCRELAVLVEFYRRRYWLLQRQHGLARSQEDAIPFAAGEKLDAQVRLSPVRLKGQGDIALVGGKHGLFAVAAACAMSDSG